MIYLDNAATTLPKPPGVVDAVLRALNESGSLGRSAHQAAEKAAELAFGCRMSAGQLFEADPEQIVFTMNATHALNLAVGSLVSPRDSVVISGFEHNAVLRPLHALGVHYETAGRRLFDQADTLRSFERAITRKTKAVICTHVSNVFGYILPIHEIAELCRCRGVPLIVDASQSAGHLPLSMKKLQATFLAMPGHKGLFGPQGTGLLICGDKPLKPLLYGGTGSMSRSLDMPAYLPDRGEAGTQNIHGIAGLMAGMEFVRTNTAEAIEAHERELIRRLVQKLKFLDADELFYSSAETQSGVLSVRVKGMDCEMLGRKLAQQGIAVRTGLHCAPLAHESAGTLETGTVRFGVSVHNTAEEIDAAADQIFRILDL